MMDNKLKIEYVNIKSIKMYSNNSKLHSKEQIQQIKNSIREFGFNDPIAVWKNNEIIEGHGRLKAAQELGYKELPIIRLDDLSDEQRKAYCLAHNKLTMNSDFDPDVLLAELNSILDIDMSEFGFPTLEFPEESEPREKDGYFGDARENTYKSTNFDRYDEHRTAGFYQMPIIKACDYVPTDLIGFNYAKSTDKTNCGVHFFIDDYQFERVWNSPDENIERLRKFQCVLTPDWSLYMDMPMALKVWNVYRQRLIGQIFQDSGLTVIPTLSWAEPETYNFCFDGIEQGGTVAVSTVGVVRSEESRKIWFDGMSKAIEILKPCQILLYGSDIGFDFGNIKTKHYKVRKFGE